MKKSVIIKNNKEKQVIGNKIRYYIDCLILVCCLVVVFNIHSNDDVKTDDNMGISTMKYIFHDYEGNTYILNDSTHGTTNSLDYLMDDEVPETIKNSTENVTGTVSLADIVVYKDQKTNTENEDNIQESVSQGENVKDNQISIDEIIQELGIDGESGELIIDFDNIENDTGYNQDSYYTVIENEDGTTMTITKNTEENELIDNEDVIDGELVGKVFSFVIEGQIHPILIPRNQLPIGKDGKSITYIDKDGNIGYVDTTGVTIVDEYEDCMTPRGYKIVHGDSVLAYQQKKNAPDICNIERRYCWKGKLSGTYTQQGCSVNTNYTYSQWGEAEILDKDEDVIPDTVQNPDGSVKVNDKEIGSSFVFDRPSQKSTPEYHETDNVVTDEEVEQTTRPHRDCTAPRGEKVKHGQIVQAFKHANGFSDAPCEAQIRICSMGNLMGSYTESTCKTRDTSFIDRINGSPTRETYSKEKLNWVKKLIKAEQSYDRDYGRRTNIDELDRILTILDS